MAKANLTEYGRSPYDIRALSGEKKKEAQTGFFLFLFSPRRARTCKVKYSEHREEYFMPTSREARFGESSPVRGEKEKTPIGVFSFSFLAPKGENL